MELFMKKLIIGLVCLFATSAWAQAPAQAPRYAWHNGSLMEIDPLPQNMIQIRYVQPRPDLFPYAQPGTVLLYGQWDANGLNVTAYTISRCGQIPYPMHGTLDPSGNLVIQGPAPLLDPYTCGVISMIWSPRNSTLVFTPAQVSQ